MTGSPSYLGSPVRTTNEPSGRESLNVKQKQPGHMFQKVADVRRVAFVEGGEGSGKTHFAMTSPGPHYLIETEYGHNIDTAKRMNPDVLVATVAKQEIVRPSLTWFSGKGGLWDLYEQACMDVVKMPSGTVIVDSVSDLMAMAVAQLDIDWSRGEQAFPPMMYGPVYKMLNNSIGLLRSKHNVVMCSKIKQEFGTSNWVTDAWRDAKFMAEVVVSLEGPVAGRHRLGSIYKNHLEGLTVVDPTWDRVFDGDRDELDAEYQRFKLMLDIEKAEAILDKAGVTYERRKLNGEMTVENAKEYLAHLGDVYRANKPTNNKKAATTKED